MTAGSPAAPTDLLAALGRRRHATGVLVWARQTGVVHRGLGIVTVARRDPKGIDAALAEATVMVADHHRLLIELDYLTLGKHVTHSRHYRSLAWDSDFIGPVGQGRVPVTVHNPQAVLVLGTFRSAGWVFGEPPGQPGLILGPAHTLWNPTDRPHAGHLHCSLAP